MSASMSADSAAPNLTPILDMVFQLITFFMLVINFKAASLDTTLELPVLGSARPIDTGGDTGLLVLNVDAEGQLKVTGRVKKNIEDYIKQEAVASRIYAKIHGHEPPENDKNELLTMVVVRADKATPFKLLNRIIKSCQENGFRRFSLKAMNKKKEEAH
ncbi:MAG TPA: biopolymer transporter ExbD [Pirellulales bacterium]|nr:biopolymer transporter ExbD [Pirellulales bacterium]